MLYQLSYISIVVAAQSSKTDLEVMSLASFHYSTAASELANKRTNTGKFH